MKPRTARDVLSTPVVTITRDRRLTEALSRRLGRHISGLPVVGEQDRERERRYGGE